jgi:apolipoprotein N-acyltransferase
MNKIFSKEAITKAAVYLAAILISGSCWYISNGLNGNHWYLLWIAPVPVLMVVLTSGPWTAFTVSFLAYLVGRLSWFSYLVSVMTITPALINTIVLSLIFAVIIVITRILILRTKKWYSVMIFPALWTSVEFLIFNFSPDGTAGSIAYSQSNVLPLVQVASVTGILGITFIITLVPSAIALGWYYYRIHHNIVPVFISSGIIVLVVLIFGWIRLGNKPVKTVNIGISVLQEKFHSVSTDSINSPFELIVAGFYAQQVNILSKEGATAVLLPERAIAIDSKSDSMIYSHLSSTARSNNVYIITGYTNLKNKIMRNSAMVIDSAGQLISDYNKAHLVKGLEDKFAPGKNIAIFDFNRQKAGVAVCKDLDFPDYIRKYGKEKIDVLFVPAWDFGVDDWLHSRMAILRGVENGFSEVRAAREGRLTISDPEGRVHFESITADKYGHTLIDGIPLKGTSTIYTSLGNWFGYFCLILSVIYISMSFSKKTKD